MNIRACRFGVLPEIRPLERPMRGLLFNFSFAGCEQIFCAICVVCLVYVSRKYPPLLEDSPTNKDTQRIAKVSRLESNLSVKQHAESKKVLSDDYVSERTQKKF